MPILLVIARQLISSAMSAPWNWFRPYRELGLLDLSSFPSQACQNETTSRTLSEMGYYYR